MRATFRIVGLIIFIGGFVWAPAAAETTGASAAVVERAIASTLERFAAQKLTRDNLAVTLLDLRHPMPATRGSLRGDVAIYPASVIKLFYLAAAHAWLENRSLADTPELRRALKDMIVDSSNDATHYIVDLLTGTTSGPELPEDELNLWFEKRNAVTRYFSALGYTGVLAHKKPWGDGPYGRESQAMRLFEPRRNLLTTDATARLLAEIVTGQSVSRERSAEMQQLLARDPATKSADPDDQAKFIGAGLPPGAKLWSKAGWTSQTRHDAAYIELPNGAKCVLVIFTTGHAHEREIIPHLTREIVAGLR